MNALEIAKNLGKTNTLDKIRKSGLREYGIYSWSVAEKLEEDSVVFVAAALNNEDTEHMLLSFLRENPGQVLKGLETAAFLMGAEQMQLYLPENETQLKKEMEETINDYNWNIQVISGIADVRKLSQGCIFHIETLKHLADVVEDSYVPGARISVKKVRAEGNTYSQPMFIPYGTSLNQILEKDFMEDMEHIKAVWMGNWLYDASVLTEAITEDTPLGNGVISIFEHSCCMIKAAEDNLLIKRKAACGKCTFCREGMTQLYTRLHEITSGKGEWSGVEVMKEIGETMPFSTLCSMGQTGGALVMETFRMFAEEYEDHMKKKRCTAGTCPAFVNVYISPDKCSGCGACIPACPMDCIEGLQGYIHMVEDIDCTKCGTCLEVCKEAAIIKTVEKVPRLPDRLTRTGRFKRY